MIPVELDLVGAAMHSRFDAEGKPGVTMRKGANYSTWWNGGLRTSAYFHNQIGLLTETIGNPTPVEIEFVPQRMLPNADMPMPITPQTWHFRQSIDYSITANWAVLDLVARMKETFLFRMYKMGKNSIDRGNRDSWTFTPARDRGHPGQGREGDAPAFRSRFHHQSDHGARAASSWRTRADAPRWRPRSTSTS